MPDGSKRLHANDKTASEPTEKYRFLPAAALPPNLPSGAVAIAEMANAFGVTHRTLHFYEEKGLITASRVGLMRVYNRQDVLQMAIINICREIGMPIAVIQELMEELHGVTSQEESNRTFQNALMVRKRELMAGLSTVRRQMQQITNLLEEDVGELAPATNDNREESGSLSEIERRCLELMAEGHTQTRIARSLEMKNEEISALETEIIRKFNANNRFQAVAKAVLLGIVHS